MKKGIYSIFALVLLIFASCTEDDYLGNAIDSKNTVRISVKTTSRVVTRANTVEDTDLENRIDWIDVFVFNANDEKTVFHKERIDVSSAPVHESGEFTLAKKRVEFGEDTPYYVYVVANAKANLVSNEAGIDNWSDLQALVQNDYNLHLTAFVDEQGSPAFTDAPERFLMDGFVYLTAESPSEMGTCIINAPEADNVLLSGTLNRAAAKFIINIKQGANVEFKQELEDNNGQQHTPQYYINQLPISTRVLPQAATDYYQPTTQNTATVGPNPYTLVWNKDNSMTITGYGYADDWSELEYTKQTSMVFNLPMLWDKDKNADNGKEESLADNWYKIPLSKEKKFDRNTCYIINITVNAVGAEEKEYAIELKDIEYITLPWEKVTMDLGGYGAAFLTLNTDLVKIYDTNIDENQLTFTSSSPIVSIKLKDTFSHNEQSGAFEQGGALIGADGLPTGEYTGTDGVYAYYIDKFGQKIQLGTDPGFDIKVIEQPEWTKDDILAKELNLYKKEGVADNAQYIRAEVWDEHKRALNGNITIHSPILPVTDNEDLNWPSHFNTVRYLEFEVTNLQGIKAIFRVEHTPVTVISNIESYFSYRDDYIVDGTLQHNPGAFASEFGKQKPEYHGPIHLLNPRAPFFVLAGFLPYHADEVNEQGVHINTNCTSSYNGFEELLYGFMERIYHRTYAWGGPVASVFHRDHYMTENGSHFYNSNKNNPSNYYIAVGFPYYDAERNKYYRRHYTGNFFETFWSKKVEKVYLENGVNPNGYSRLRGQADIIKLVPNGTFDGWEMYSRPRYYVNHRMYHVRVTSTSNEYIIANPQLMDENGNPINDRGRGYTMEGDINARIVSPSFMVASQLGESILPTNEHHYVVPGIEGIYYYAKRQCQDYAEARYDDLNGNNEYDAGEPVYHYNDWRLPTRAEIEYIVKHQETSRAMDKVLYAQKYFHASIDPDVYTAETLLSEEIPNYDTSHLGYYMRCVRDAYIEPEPVYYDENYNIVKVGK